MLKTLEKRCRRIMFCAAPVSMAPNTGLDLIGLPDQIEAKLLVVAVGIFLAMGYAAFQIWARPPVCQGPSIAQHVPALAD